MFFVHVLALLLAVPFMAIGWTFGAIFLGLKSGFYYALIGEEENLATNMPPLPEDV